MNPVIRVIRIVLFPSPHPNLLIAERMLEIFPVLQTASLDVRPESKARIIRLADREWSAYGGDTGVSTIDSGSKECKREFTKHWGATRDG